MKNKTVTVVEANGTMVANDSTIFAPFGRATVYTVRQDKEKSKKTTVSDGKLEKADCIIYHLNCTPRFANP